MQYFYGGCYVQYGRSAEDLWFLMLVLVFFNVHLTECYCRCGASVCSSGCVVLQCGCALASLSYRTGKFHCTIWHNENKASFLLLTLTSIIEVLQS